MNSEKFILEALEEARKARLNNEVPIGAVVVKNNEIIGRGQNSVITLSDVSAHAEILAMKAAGKVLNNYRLIGCTIYTTIEPCIMCYGALVHARVEKIVYGAKEPKWGALGSLIDLNSLNNLNHKIKIEESFLKEECSNLIVNFFKEKRNFKKNS